jgi:hypothetical protein
MGELQTQALSFSYLEAGFVVLITHHIPNDLECGWISFADPEWGSYKLKP